MSATLLLQHNHI
ncbi:hypothetical protein CIB84_004832 [Bambusicola thoracicus]|uniref:Uncharacterized protein n=1 Tax=Bambusicola thoracicus TaxID=9083 RepID=A0A2P4T4W6_BAMTH|nr:hypothetical protein CIB84_004832 [Bambusicola thoracicus]